MSYCYCGAASTTQSNTVPFVSWLLIRHEILKKTLKEISSFSSMACDERQTQQHCWGWNCYHVYYQKLEKVVLVMSKVELPFEKWSVLATDGARARNWTYLLRCLMWNQLMSLQSPTWTHWAAKQRWAQSTTTSLCCISVNCVYSMPWGFSQSEEAWVEFCISVWNNLLLRAALFNNDSCKDSAQDSLIQTWKISCK